MSRYIDADGLNECMSIVQKANRDSIEFNKRCRATDVFQDIWGMIKAQPNADVVEVVRCRDCVHYQPSLFGEKNMCFRKDVDGVQICYDFSPNDYCSYGERREDERNGNT